jgi:uncharacterized protein
MKIYIDKIPPEGLEIVEDIDPRVISLDVNYEGISFTKYITATAKILKAGGEVLADIKLEAPVEYMCGRCLAKFPDIFTKKFKTSYEARPGSVIDLDEDIRQEIILDYPMRSLCKPDCKGLCHNCGQNLNIEQCECPSEDDKKKGQKGKGLDL